jgi:hypothetical protein
MGRILGLTPLPAPMPCLSILLGGHNKIFTSDSEVKICLTQAFVAPVKKSCKSWIRTERQDFPGEGRNQDIGSVLLVKAVM